VLTPRSDRTPTPRGQPLPDFKDIPGVGDALKAVDQALCPAPPLPRPAHATLGC
jgi:hypothetical protein